MLLNAKMVVFKEPYLVNKALQQADFTFFRKKKV